jgi:hypothetical protein
MKLPWSWLLPRSEDSDDFPYNFGSLNSTR